MEENKITDFEKRVYEVTLKIPRGYVSTYGDIAKQLGSTKYSRAVGNALHRNPDPDTVPCYRVVNREGCLAQHFGDGGIEGQTKRLSKDNIVVTNGKVDLDKYRWNF